MRNHLPVLPEPKASTPPPRLQLRVQGRVQGQGRHPGQLGPGGGAGGIVLHVLSDVLHGWQLEVAKYLNSRGAVLDEP